MPPLKPGFYAFMSPNAADLVALDRVGPFDSRDDVFAWGREFNIAYRSHAEIYDRAVLYAGEMTSDQSDGPWFTAVHQVG